MKVVGGFSLVLILAFVLANYAMQRGFSMKKDAEGNVRASLFWGGIEIDEDQDVADSWDELTSVGVESGPREKLSKTTFIEASPAPEQGSGHDIVVNVEESVVRIKKDIVLKVAPHRLQIDGRKIKTDLLSKFLNIKISNDDVWIEGNKIGEDGTHIHFKAMREKKNVTSTEKVNL